VQVTLPYLINACKEDEEIVVVDGGSNDGTSAYLQKLFEEGKIHQFISEKDHGEGHGYNKSFLKTRGELIKIVSDDDAYYFEGIEQCKKFMLGHPEIEVLGADGFAVNNSLQKNEFSQRYDIERFKKWQGNKKPFIFCGLSMMFRRDALPVIGLVNNNFIITDFEYTLRITSGKAKIAWYTGLVYVNIINAQSNSGTQWRRMEMEREKLEQLYFNKRILIPFQTKDKVKNIFRPLKKKLFPQKMIEPVNYFEIYQQSMQYLIEGNKGIKHDYLY
jgi:glycosyltransferase involved in cell wall biosynthesis